MLQQALFIGGKAPSLESGVKMAEELIDSGKAYGALEKYIEASNK